MSDEISTLFHEASAPSMGVDPYAVLAGGRRRRHRHIAAVSSAMTALAAVAIVAAVNGLGGQGLANRVPADGSGTPKATASATMGSDTPFRSSTGATIPGPSKVVVEVDPSQEGNLGYYSVDAGGKRTLLARSQVALPSPSAPADGWSSAVTWGTGSTAPHLLIGVLPASAEQWAIVAPGATGGAAGDHAPLLGTGLQAFLSVYDNASDASKVTGLVWIDGTGIVRDQDGVVPTAILQQPARAGASLLGVDEVGFVDARLSVWGTFTSTGSSTAPITSGSYRQFSVSGGDATNPAEVVALVPANATNPQVTFATGCTQRQGPSLVDAGDGQHAFLVATCRPTSSSGQPMTGFSYTVDGQTIRSQ